MYIVGTFLCCNTMPSRQERRMGFSVTFCIELTRFEHSISKTPRWNIGCHILPTWSENIHVSGYIMAWYTCGDRSLYSAHCNSLPPYFRLRWKRSPSMFATLWRYVVYVVDRRWRGLEISAATWLRDLNDYSLYCYSVRIGILNGFVILRSPV